MSKGFFNALALLFTLVASLSTPAQTLIQQVPDEAAVYVGWRGSSDMGPGYEGSNLQGVLEATGLLEAMPELMGLIQSVQAEGHVGEDEGAMLAMVASLVTSALDDGGAMYVLPPAPNGPPIPRLCVLWQKGEGPQDALREALNTVVMILQEELPAFTGAAGDAMYLSIGFDAGAQPFQSLAGSPRFASSAKQVQGDAALVAYIDVSAWRGQVDQFVASMKQRGAERNEPLPPFVQLWPTISREMGLDGVETLTMSAGLHEKNWHSRLFLGVPSPRRGVFMLLDNEPIKRENLLHVPKSATLVQAYAMQPGRVLDVAVQIAGAIDPGMADMIDQSMKDASEAVGFDIEMELIRGLGPVWTAYVDPMIAGNGFASIVFTNELQDPASVLKAMNQLSEKANEALADAEDIKIRLLTRTIDGKAITHLGIPFVAPAWTVHNGRLYVALYPQALEMAVAQSGKEEDSILANQAFQSAMHRFLDLKEPVKLSGSAFDNLRPVNGLSFADLHATAAEGHGMMMMLMQALSGASEMFTGQASSARMPPIGKLLPFIESAGGITRVDPLGLHLHWIEPFPGATLLSASKGLGSGAGLSAPMAVGVMLPALGAARRTARAMQTSTQARQLHMANFTYSADHDDNFADDIAKLEDYFGDPEILISAHSIRGSRFPMNFTQLPKEVRADLIRKNSSFVLVPVGNANQLKNMGQTVMIFERPDDTDRDVLTATMADGATMQIDRDELEAMLQKQTGQSLQQLIKRQENFAP